MCHVFSIIGSQNRALFCRAQARALLGVVGSYIFDYAQHLQSIAETAGTPQMASIQKTKVIENESEKINQLHRLYLKTVLTPQEKKEFEVFFDLCKKMMGKV